MKCMERGFIWWSPLWLLCHWNDLNISMPLLQLWNWILFFFFVFWWEDRINYYYSWKAIDTSYRRVCSIKQGLPSIPIEKVAMPKACFARRWVGLLPSLRTWDNSTLWKSWREDRTPYTIVATDAGGGAISFKALIKFSESFSRIMSWISIVAAQPYGQGGPIII